MHSTSSRARRALPPAVGLVAGLTFTLFLAGFPRAEAKGKKEPHLRYATTYAAAVTEARSRNAVIFATFHKDN